MNRPSALRRGEIGDPDALVGLADDEALHVEEAQRLAHDAASRSELLAQRGLRPHLARADVTAEDRVAQTVAYEPHVLTLALQTVAHTTMVIRRCGTPSIDTCQVSLTHVEVA